MSGSPRVVFAPFLPANPYQTLLMRALEGKGARVSCLPLDHTSPRALARTLAESRPDVLHLHWLHHFFFASNALAARWRAHRFLRVLRLARSRGTRIVWTAHNLRNHEGRLLGLDARVTRGVARISDAIIAHGERARERVVEDTGADRARIAVIPHGSYIGAYPDGATRAEARERLGIDADAFVVLFFGRIRAYKGLLPLLDAFSGAALPESAILLVAGKALGKRDRVRVKRRCRRHPRVRLDHGYIEDDRAQHYFRAADVVALPYRDSLTSGAAVLAMSFGCPLLAPRISSILDLTDDEGAILYDPESERGLAEALERAHRERDRLPAMGRANRARAEGWRWDAIAAETLDVYRKAAVGH